MSSLRRSLSSVTTSGRGSSVSGSGPVAVSAPLVSSALRPGDKLHLAVWEGKIDKIHKYVLEKGNFPISKSKEGVRIMAGEDAVFDFLETEFFVKLRKPFL